MGIRISHLKTNVRKVTVDLGMDELEAPMAVNIWYRPLAMTAVKEDEFQAMLKDDEYTDALISFLTEVVFKWDLLEDTEEDEPERPFPIEEKTMREVLPVTFLRKRLEEIMGDMYPKKENGSSFVGT